MSASEPQSPPPGRLAAADGRLPGRRGRATRKKLLDATAALLETTGYRDLKVVDIARRAGTSPATFYQYFPEVDAAIVLLAGEMADEGSSLAEAARGPWTEGAAYGTAVSLVGGFMDFWERHQAVLRVVDLAIAEGDPRFREIRTHMLNPVTVALEEAIAAAQRPGISDARASAAVLVSMVAHVAEHRRGLEAWGVRASSAVHSMAELIAWTVGRASSTDGRR